MKSGKYTLCIHNFRISRCCYCEKGGSEMCCHKHQKFSCIICKNNCKHNKRLYKCKECYVPFDKSNFLINSLFSLSEYEEYLAGL